MVEIAERLGVSRATVVKWRQRDVGFPEPSVTVSGTPIWSWPRVEAWHRGRTLREGRAGEVRPELTNGPNHPHAPEVDRRAEVEPRFKK